MEFMPSATLAAWIREGAEVSKVLLLLATVAIGEGAIVSGDASGVSVEVDVDFLTVMYTASASQR